MVLVQWNRAFRVWNYSFGYSQLLLRSAPKYDGDLRVDVLFSNVRWMNVPTKFSALAIERVEKGDFLDNLGIAEVIEEPFEIFLINGGVSMILATGCQWHEDFEWVDAPSHFGPFRAVK